MITSHSDYIKARLRHAIQDGLPLTPRPYRTLAEALGTTEKTVIDLLRELKEDGLIKRMGLIVKHRALGYDANAMVVWDVPDNQVDQLGYRFKAFDYVTLCYRRPRKPPNWPYNLFSMIHGRDRDTVLEQVEAMVDGLCLHHIDRAVLFSTHCFKQSGGRYSSSLSDFDDRIEGGAVRRFAKSDRLPGQTIRIQPGTNQTMDNLDKAIINRLQDGLPLCARPYQVVAPEFGTDEQDVIDRLQKLLAAGYLTRFGPMYHAEEMGGGLTLAALKVPAERFDEVAAIVNAFPQVAHNYERNHEFNMWFVLATETIDEIGQTIADIEERTGLKVYNMPKEEEFYVGLRFHL